MALFDGPVDAVLLDSGGVLMLPDPARMRAALGSLGADADDEDCRRAHYASMREVDRLGEADWAAVDRVLAREAGVPENRVDDSVPLLDDVYLRQPWIPIAGAAEALVTCRKPGTRSPSSPTPAAPWNRCWPSTASARSTARSTLVSR